MHINLTASTIDLTGPGFSSTSINRQAIVTVGSESGALLLDAGHNLNLRGAMVASAGTATLAAGNDLSIGGVRVGYDSEIGESIQLPFPFLQGRRFHLMQEEFYLQRQEYRDIGSLLVSSNDLSLLAGNDLSITGSTLLVGRGELLAMAVGDVNIAEGRSKSLLDYNAIYKESRFLGNKSESNHILNVKDQSVGSVLSADRVTIMGGNDLTVAGSAVVGTSDVFLSAGNDVSITTAQNTFTRDSLHRELYTGILTGTFSIGYGAESSMDTIRQLERTNTGSMVGSVFGNLSLLGGGDVFVQGSELITGQDLSIIGGSIDIVEATDSFRFDEQQYYRTMGLTIGVKSPIISAGQTISTLSNAIGKSNDTRIQALGVIAGGLSVYNNAGGMKQSAQGIGEMISSGEINGSSLSKAVSLSITVGESNSRTYSSFAGDTTVGSGLFAGGDVSLVATDGDITVRGSDIIAAGDALLSAPGDILLAAAANPYNRQNSGTGFGFGLGVGFGIGEKSGIALEFFGSAFTNQADGGGVTWRNTHVLANTVTLESGGDTTLRGAVVSGNQVVADVGGDLKIESLQDTDMYHENGSHGGFNASIALGPGSSGGGVSGGSTKIDSDYRSVTEQSSIRAGDGGFQVNVGGNTDLVGGAITSTRAAIDNELNRFYTGGTLTMSDIVNRAEYSGSSYGFAIGSGSSPGFGTGNEGDNAGSITRSGISGIAGNKAARTGDAETGIAPIFDLQKVQDNLDASVTITQTFTQEAGQAVRTYARAERERLQEQLKNAQTEEEKEQILAEIRELNRVERIANVTIGVMAGQIVPALVQGVLSEANDLMTQYQIEDSKKAPSLCVPNTNDCISNASGDSTGGILGYLFKLGGGRIVLEKWCADGRCKESDVPTAAYIENADGTKTYYVLNDDGKSVKFEPKDQDKNPITIAQFIADHPDWVSSLGGVQGWKGQVTIPLLGSIPYGQGDFLDILVEAYAGVHDVMNSWIWYDSLGNAKNLQGIAKIAGEVMNWANVAGATPFALGIMLPPGAWNALSIALRR